MIGPHRGRRRAWRNRLNNEFDSFLLEQDFDAIGGMLSFQQIRNPQIVLCASGPGSGDPDAASGDNGRPEATRRAILRATRPESKKRNDRECRCCVPYNGHHTPDYWGTNQKDIW